MNEVFRKINYHSMKRRDISVELEVGNYGTVKHNGAELKQRIMSKSNGYVYCVFRISSKKTMLISVHRAVAMAWCENDDP